MARTISITLSDALEAQIRAEAKARGDQSLDECALRLLREALSRVPRVADDPRQLERQLREGLAGAARTPTREEWDRKKVDLEARHKRSKAG